MIGTLIGAMAAATVVNNIGDIGSGIGSIISGTRNQKKLAENPDKYAAVTTDSSSFLNDDYRDVVNAFVGMGFYNVAVREQYESQGILIKTDRTGRVTGVSINGKDTFTRNEVFEKSAYIVVTAIIHERGKHLPLPQSRRPQQQNATNTQNQQFNGQGQMGMQSQRPMQYQQRPVQPIPEKRCAYCNVLVSQGQKFCNRCGAPL